MKRLFLAIPIPIPPEFETYYKKLQHALSCDVIKWSEPKNLHLTMQFFGNTHSSRLLKYKKVCQEIIPQHTAFDNSLTRLGVFGSRYAPKIVWMGMSAEEEFKNLKRDLQNGFESCGYKPDRQNFVPHLTLGRITHTQSKPYFQKMIESHRHSPENSFKVNEVFLYESILHKEGPEYKVIEKYELS